MNSGLVQAAAFNEPLAAENGTITLNTDPKCLLLCIPPPTLPVPAGGLFEPSEFIQLIRSAKGFFPNTKDLAKAYVELRAVLKLKSGANLSLLSQGWCFEDRIGLLLAVLEATTTLPHTRPPGRRSVCPKLTLRRGL